jgi:hypothetical protein
MLLTVDEARTEILRSAVACLLQAPCGPEALLAILHATAEPADPTSARLAGEHAGVLAAVRAAGHGWVIEDQLGGICEAAGLADGEVRNVDALALLAGVALAAASTAA